MKVLADEPVIAAREALWACDPKAGRVANSVAIFAEVLLLPKNGLMDKTIVMLHPWTTERREYPRPKLHKG
jgi:hypothetical protein